MDRLQLQHLLQIVRKYDLADNTDPAAIFDPLIQGFNIWCTPADNPGGDWFAVANQMTQGSWTKPCEFVATVFAVWDGEIKNITHFSLSTSSYALVDHLPQKYISQRSEMRKDNCKLIFNLPTDIAWAKRKAKWIFQQASLATPSFVVEEE